MTNALTIDFEDWYQGLEIPHTTWDGFQDRIALAGRRLLAILADAGARATFFVLGRVAEQHPELVRAIDAAGHEIGTHGYSHTLIYQQTPEVFQEELARSIRLLEGLAGKPVIGTSASGCKSCFLSVVESADDTTWATGPIAMRSWRTTS